MAVLLCPLCSQPRFNNLESLRLSLINAATQNISCPICSEVLLGLDKLTIHLFGHTLNQNTQNNCMELKISKGEDITLRIDEEPFNHPIVSLEKDIFETPSNELVSVNECLSELIENKEKTRNTNQCTVNMEDLSFLTSWENSFRDETKNPDVKRNDIKQDEESPVSIQEDTSELSEYMSDLLNKKLPTINFTFETGSSEKTETVEEPEKKHFKCPHCDFTFPNSIVLSIHQEMVHSIGKKEEEPGGGESFAGVATDIFKDLILPRYDCHLCTKSFKLKSSLLVHYRVAHVGAGQSDLPSASGGDDRSFHCLICSKSFKKEQHLTQHIKTHEGKQWQCETCNKHFTTKYFLKKHQRLHTGEMPYSCQTCSKTFTFQQSYHKHLLYHSDEKPHQCSQCGRSFKELSTLHNHQRIHSGEKPFACETCGKCFRQRVSFIVHQRIHTGVLPYQCTACKKKFRYKVSQRSHKCSAQPPGIVVRQPGDLIQKILEQRKEGLQCFQ